MLRRIVDNLSYLGLAALSGGYLWYSIENQWDWKIQTAIYGGLALLGIFLLANLKKIRTGLKTRTGRHGATAGVTLVLVLSILVLVNFLNFRYHKRLDLTEQQLHTLSEQSQKVVKNLDGGVRLIGFFQTEGGARRFQELVREYRFASAQVAYEVVDPQKEPGKVSQYDIQRDGQVVVASDLRDEIVDDFTEEKITNAIIKVTREEEKIIYFLKGHGERDLDDTSAQGLSVAREAIEKQNYQVETFNLAQENSLPEDANVIVSTGPKMDLFPNEMELVRQFLDSGGKFLLLVDPDNDFDMGEFLAAFGVKLGGKMVIDASGVGQLLGLGVAAPLVADYSDHPITENLQKVMTFFPMAQSVTIIPSSLGYESQALLSTSSHSWAESDLEADEVAFDEGEDVRGPLDLAVVSTLLIEGSNEENGPESEKGNEQAEDSNQGKNPKEEEREARLALFGDSDFASNAYFRSAANADLFLNTLSWLAEDTDLTAIRPKNPQDRRVNLTFGQSRLIFWGTVVLLPLATLICGISVWYRRR